MQVSSLFKSPSTTPCPDQALFSGARQGTRPSPPMLQFRISVLTSLTFALSRTPHYRTLVQTNTDGVKIFIAPDGSQTQRDPDGTEISTGLDVRL